MKKMVYLLVVDDEPDSASLFRQSFRREIRRGSLDLRTAFSGTEALQVMEELHDKSPLLVLSDINMPGMDGLELLDRLRSLYPKLRVGLVSAFFGGGDFTRRAKEAGADPIVPKPVDFSELKAYIENLED